MFDQYAENQRKYYVEPLEALMAEVGSISGKHIELHPTYTPALRQGNSLYVGYKMHEKGPAVDRILNLLVSETEYTQGPSGTWRLQPNAALQVKSEILSFWSREESSHTRTVYIPKPRRMSSANRT